MVNSSVETEKNLHIDGTNLVIPLLHITETDINGLPEPQPGVLYIVSGIVAAIAGGHGRVDVVSPSRAQRGGKGRVESARALARIERKLRAE